MRRHDSRARVSSFVALAVLAASGCIAAGCGEADPESALDAGTDTLDAEQSTAEPLDAAQGEAAQMDAGALEDADSLEDAGDLEDAGVLEDAGALDAGAALQADSATSEPNTSGNGKGDAGPTASCGRERVTGVTGEPTATRVSLSALCEGDRCGALVDYDSLVCRAVAAPGAEATLKRTQGCGLVAFETLSPLPARKYVFDAASATLVGAFTRDDIMVALKNTACSDVSYVAGSVDLSCPDASEQVCVRSGG